MLYNVYVLVDHILLMEADESLIQSIKINENEVAAVKFVPISLLRGLDQTELTPWLQKILETDLLSQWIDEFADISTSAAPINLTKYSSQPIIKL